MYILSQNWSQVSGFISLQTNLHSSNIKGYGKGTLDTWLFLLNLCVLPRIETFLYTQNAYPGLRVL